MPRLLYSCFFYLLLPLILLRLAWRSVRAPAYRRRIAERFGFYPRALRRQLAESTQPLVWVHAVSVGEVVAAVPLVRALQQRWPDCRIHVTTMTPTGSERVRSLLGESVSHCYAPWDLPFAVDRLRQLLKPALLIIMETELWPNTIHQLAASGVPVLLANGRMSARSARGYQRFAALTRPMLAQLSAVAAQSGPDAERFIALGARPDRVVETGSIKLDVTLDDTLRQRAAALKQQWFEPRPRRIWVAASTHAGEETVILDALRQLDRQQTDGVLLVLVPRHPERFNRVVELCEQRGFNTLRFSSGALPDAATEVVVGDTMGDLNLLYGLADLALVGGSLIPRGGHNMLEPALWGLPIITGPSDFNFLHISRGLQEAGGLLQVRDARSLQAAVHNLLQNPGQAARMGSSALHYVEQSRGAMERLLSLLEEYRPVPTCEKHRA